MEIRATEEKAPALTGIVKLLYHLVKHLTVEGKGKVIPNSREQLPLEPTAALFHWGQGHQKLEPHVVVSLISYYFLKAKRWKI